MGLAGSLVEDASVTAVEVEVLVLIVVISRDWGNIEVEVRTDGDDIEGAGIDVDGLNV